MFRGAAVVMGVAGCGKTSVAEALAAGLGADFVEGDKLHPKANIEKMSSGVALTDGDRWPWLQSVGEALCGRTGVIAACSALKRAYRERIAVAAGRPVHFVFLDGDLTLLQQRTTARKGHFMPPSLLDSQMATLERPCDDELAKRFDVSKSSATIVHEARLWLLQGEST